MRSKHAFALNLKTFFLLNLLGHVSTDAPLAPDMCKTSTNATVYGTFFNNTCYELKCLADGMANMTTFEWQGSISSLIPGKPLQNETSGDYYCSPLDPYSCITAVPNPATNGTTEINDIVPGTYLNGVCMAGMCVQDPNIVPSVNGTWNITAADLTSGQWFQGQCYADPPFVAQFEPNFALYVLVLCSCVIAAVISLGNMWLSYSLTNFNNLKVFDVLSMAGSFCYFATQCFYIPFALSGWPFSTFFWTTPEGYVANLVTSNMSLLFHRLTMLCFVFMSIYRFIMIRTIAEYPIIINYILIIATAILYGADILGVHIWFWVCQTRVTFEQLFVTGDLPSCYDPSGYSDSQYGIILIFYYLVLDILLGVYFIIVVLKTKRLWSRARQPEEPLKGARRVEELLLTQIVRYFYIWIAVTWITLICWSLSLGVTADGFYAGKISFFFSNIGVIFEAIQFTLSIAFLAKMRSLAAIASGEISRIQQGSSTDKNSLPTNASSSYTGTLSGYAVYSGFVPQTSYQSHAGSQQYSYVGQQSTTNPTSTIPPTVNETSSIPPPSG